MTINLVAYDIAVVGSITVAQIVFGAVVVLLIYYIIKFILSIATGG